jgi:hypothetical protein
MGTLMEVALIWVGFMVLVLVASRVIYHLVGRSNERRLRDNAEIYQKLMGSWSEGGNNKSNSRAGNLSGRSKGDDNLVL